MKIYSGLEELLYRRFLGDNPFSNHLYQRLVNKSKRKPSSNNRKHVFITGLARSGTTALLYKMYSSEKFSSFTYKNLPFILSPNLARLFLYLTRRKTKLIERYHNDGLFIDSNSPECLTKFSG